MSRVAVIGAGSWGTALAGLLARQGHPCVLWSRNERVARQIREERVNAEYLPDVELPRDLRVTLHWPEALDAAEFVVVAVPSHAVREIVFGAAAHVPDGAVLVSGTKGLEVETLDRPSQILREVFPGHPAPVVITGPSFAWEVAHEMPTAVTAASEDEETARRVQRLFSTSRFRVYTDDDVIGAELGGALKNVIALAAGIADGLGYGHNSRAAIITRGLAEITRLGLALGARTRTFAGLSGLGDLVLTCTGDLSRNRSVGLRLGRGERLDDILTGMKMVAEGIKTTRAARRLARSTEVEMPIVEEVYTILFDGKPPEQATADLMLREPKPEHWGAGHGS